MASRPPRVDDRSHVVRRRPGGGRGGPGPHIGPLRITPIRATLLLAGGGSLLFIAIAILRVRDAAQIPMLSAGFGVLGIVFAALALGSAIRMWRASRDDRPGQAAAFAIVGGIAGFGAIGCFTATVLFALLWSG